VSLINDVTVVEGTHWLGVPLGVLTSVLPLCLSFNLLLKAAKPYKGVNFSHQRFP